MLVETARIQKIQMENSFVSGFASNFAKRFATKAWYWQKVTHPRTRPRQLGKRSLSKPVASKCGGCEIVLLGSRSTMLEKEQVGCFHSRFSKWKLGPIHDKTTTWHCKIVGFGWIVALTSHINEKHLNFIFKIWYSWGLFRSAQKRALIKPLSRGWPHTTRLRARRLRTPTCAWMRGRASQSHSLSQRRSDSGRGGEAEIV